MYRSLSEIPKNVDVQKARSSPAKNLPGSTSDGVCPCSWNGTSPVPCST